MFSGVEKGCIENKWVNPLFATALFLYHMKISENQRFSDIFRVYRKKPVVWKNLIQKKVQKMTVF